MSGSSTCCTARTGSHPTGSSCTRPCRSSSVPPRATTLDREAGDTRYATSAAISRTNYAPGVPVAFVATGEAFPDGLTAGAAAAKLGGPVLLSPPGSVGPDATGDLDRLHPGRIVVLGGPAVFPDTTLAALRSRYPAATVTRWAGADRYATAAAVSSHTFTPGVPDVFVATGANFPDALAATAAAGAAGAPVLITPPAGLPTAVKTELARLKPARITIAGGATVVPNAIATALQGYTTGTVRRLYGQDRDGTAAAIAATFAAPVGRAMLATGLNFPDALAGAAVAGRDHAPVLLTDRACLSSVIVNQLNRLTPTQASILGGVGAVGAPVDAFAPCSNYTPAPPPPPPAPAPAPAPVSVRISKVQYDSPGADDGSNTSLNAEYVVVSNTGSGTATLTGWTLHDAQSHVYDFPTFTLPAGTSVTVHTGAGTDTSANLYWGSGSYIWNNTGDTATLSNASGTVVDTCTWTSTGSTSC
ncbi:MAG: cell wall-binding repeat-containing protein [Actinomycetales bacterium]